MTKRHWIQLRTGLTNKTNHSPKACSPSLMITHEEIEKSVFGLSQAPLYHSSRIHSSFENSL